MLFRSLAIPRGSVVDSATLSVVAHVITSGALPLTFRVRAGRVTAAPTTNAEHNAIVKTGAFVDWTFDAWSGGVRYTSPDISSVIEEAVGVPAWSSGDDLAVFLTSATVGWTGVAQCLRMRGYDGGAASAQSLIASGNSAP